MVIRLQFSIWVSRIQNKHYNLKSQGSETWPG